MTEGRVVFDDVPENFTENFSQSLYGIEANDPSMNIQADSNSPNVVPLNRPINHA
jgi:hypothetical protein